MLGKAGAPPPRCAWPRITPARAGKSMGFCLLISRTRDHPRACGEKLTGRDNLRIGQGSPPRVRGKEVCGFSGFAERGITPARAGKRYVIISLTLDCRDHPRMRGEKTSGLPACLRIMGSPPHARGKGVKFGVREHSTPITPACAGKRPTSRRFSPRAWDHPRMRGEKNSPSAMEYPSGQSPPHARGKEKLPKEWTGNLGITPACAGKRASRSSHSPRHGDHPRVRGEKCRKLQVERAAKGSPPRVRGKVQRAKNSRPHAGITPACAGKSTCAASCRVKNRDHPRVCGEKTETHPLFAVFLRKTPI